MENVAHNSDLAGDSGKKFIQKHPLKGVGIGLIITSVPGLMGALCVLLVVLLAFIGVGFMADINAEGFAEPLPIIQTYGILFAVLSLVNLIGNLFILLGGIRMLHGRGIKSGRLACILSLLPPFSACCMLGVPIGIWGLLKLNGESEAS